MRIDELRPGWRTDFILHRFGAEVTERADCLVVRTPSNPTFYWGNCLVLPRLPSDEDLPHWLARFDAEIAGPQPASRHVAIGIDDDWRGETRPAWAAAGFELTVHAMLRLDRGALQAPSRAAIGSTALRMLDIARESEAIIDVETTDAESFEPAGYRRYLQAQHARYRTMQAAGLLQWFGFVCDGHLAATCGLMRPAAVPGVEARFQRVLTHPAFRRRGLATALVHGVCRFAFGQWNASEVFIVADPQDVAIGIYRAAGFQAVSSGMGLQRNAPEDRAA